MFNTPVAFFVFNRPDTTRRVFAEIAKARPKILLIIADGPRAGLYDDVNKCREVREIVSNVDWDCDVLMNYSEHNMGCKERVASGIDWVFSLYEEAIILEDDCLPSQSFFSFCSEMLERFQDDSRIMSISGSSYMNGDSEPGQSYYFSIYPLIWGWATWRRAWKYYDLNIRMWAAINDFDVLRDILRDDEAAEYWLLNLTKTNNCPDNATMWDYIWMMTCWSQSGLSVTPYYNLVSNIGFGPGATHTKDLVESMSAVPAWDIVFPLKHPDFVVRNHFADRITFEKTNPWAVTPPGLYYALRKKALPYAPDNLRSAYRKVRRYLGA